MTNGDWDAVPEAEQQLAAEIALQSQRNRKLAAELAKGERELLKLIERQLRMSEKRVRGRGQGPA